MAAKEKDVQQKMARSTDAGKALGKVQTIPAVASEDSKPSERTVEAKVEVEHKTYKEEIEASIDCSNYQIDAASVAQDLRDAEEWLNQELKREEERTENLVLDYRNFVKFSICFVRNMVQQFNNCKNLVENYSSWKSYLEALGITASATVATHALVPAGKETRERLAGIAMGLTGLYKVHEIQNEQEEKERAELLLKMWENENKAFKFACSLAALLEKRFAGLIAELHSDSVEILADFFSKALINYIMFENGASVRKLRDLESWIPKVGHTLYKHQTLCFKRNLELRTGENEKWTIEGAVNRAPICLPNGAVYVKEEINKSNKDQTAKYPFIIVNATDCGSGYRRILSQSTQTVDHLSELKIDQEIKELFEKETGRSKSRKALDQFLEKINSNDNNYEAVLNALFEYSELQSALLLKEYCLSDATVRSQQLTLKDGLPFNEGHNLDILFANINIIESGLKRFREMPKEQQSQGLWERCKNGAKRLFGSESDTKKHEEYQKKIGQIELHIVILRNIYFLAKQKIQQAEKQEMQRKKTLLDSIPVAAQPAPEQDKRTPGTKVVQCAGYVMSEALDVFVFDTFRDLWDTCSHPLVTIDNTSRALRYIWNDPAKACNQILDAGADHWKANKVRATFQAMKLGLCCYDLVRSSATIASSLAPKVATKAKALQVAAQAAPKVLEVGAAIEEAAKPLTWLQTAGIATKMTVEATLVAKPIIDQGASLSKQDNNKRPR